MILESLAKLSENAARYGALHPGLAAAAKHLAATDWRNIPLGRHQFDGERLFALVGRDAGRGQAGAPLEAHRRYIDVQLVVEGTDVIGWRPLAECRDPRAEYDAGRDIVFFSDRPTTWFDVPAGSAAIFCPADAHAPLAGGGTPLKVVVKVAVDW
jgi:YhcH/YjgK/YiaL family protein